MDNGRRKHSNVTRGVRRLKSTGDAIGTPKRKKKLKVHRKSPPSSPGSWQPSPSENIGSGRQRPSKSRRKQSVTSMTAKEVPKKCSNVSALNGPDVSWSDLVPNPVSTDRQKDTTPFFDGSVSAPSILQSKTSRTSTATTRTTTRKRRDNGEAVRNSPTLTTAKTDGRRSEGGRSSQSNKNSREYQLRKRYKLLQQEYNMSKPSHDTSISPTYTKRRKSDGDAASISPSLLDYLDHSARDGRTEEQSKNIAVQGNATDESRTTSWSSLSLAGAKMRLREMKWKLDEIEVQKRIELADMKLQFEQAKEKYRREAYERVRQTFPVPVATAVDTAEVLRVQRSIVANLTDANRDLKCLQQRLSNDISILKEQNQVLVEESESIHASIDKLLQDAERQKEIEAENKVLKEVQHSCKKVYKPLWKEALVETKVFGKCERKQKKVYQSCVNKIGKHIIGMKPKRTTTETTSHTQGQDGGDADDDFATQEDLIGIITSALNACSDDLQSPPQPLARPRLNWLPLIKEQETESSSCAAIAETGHK